MIRFNPTLIVQRVRVERLQHVAYDALFHVGVNIIRGDNSSGKSTILNLIYYGLGGDIVDWSPAAQLCTRVVVQVELNGKVATLAREIAPRSGMPMDIFGGAMDDALASPPTEWSRYPYRRSETRESFSQALFRLLDIPEATTEASGNVTVHQLLRLMYADQLSPVGTLFKFEQFDPPQLRDTVGRLVFGAYENEHYANALRLKELEREHDAVSVELSGIQKLLGRAGAAPTAAWLAAERSRVQAERNTVEAELAVAERALYDAGASEGLTLEAQRSAYADVQRIQTSLHQSQSEVDAMTLEIADAEIFVRDLQSRLIALQDSSSTSNVFGSVSYQHCPACYSSVETEHPIHACHLCKTPYDSERAQTRIVKLIADTSRQLKQSRHVQQTRAAEKQASLRRLEELTQDWQQASARLQATVQTPTTAARERVRALERRAGYIERELEDIAHRQRLAGMLDDLITRKAELYGEIDKLRQKNRLIEASLQARLSVAYGAVEDEVLGLLHGDLPREEIFIHAKAVQFDFSSNKLSVNNEVYFSASSRVILRNSFFLGLFRASTKDAAFRHLRVCMLDTIEDKGMQDERSHNFQRLIVRASLEAKAEHQIIFATSMIAPDLDIDTLTVGHYSTREQRTLRIPATPA